MINSKGLVQNNSCTNELQRHIRMFDNKYGVISKAEERQLIDRMCSEHREDELRNELIIRNIRLVFTGTTGYAKNTVDYDNMVARGLYGLSYAAKKFDFYKPVTKKDEHGNKYVIVDPKTCQPEFIRFCTYATMWIRKYVSMEFSDKQLIEIDNNAISINDAVRIRNSTDNNMTMENYVNGMIAPEIVPQKTTIDRISEIEMENVYNRMHKYLMETNELTATEKVIVNGIFYDHKKIKDIAEELNINSQNIILKRDSALEKMRNYIKRECNINSLADFSV